MLEQSNASQVGGFAKQASLACTLSQTDCSAGFSPHLHYMRQTLMGPSSIWMTQAASRVVLAHPSMHSP